MNDELNRMKKEINFAIALGGTALTLLFCLCVILILRGAI